MKVSKVVQLFSRYHVRHYPLFSGLPLSDNFPVNREINRCVHFEPSGVYGSEIHLLDYSAVHTDGYPVCACVVVDLADESIYFYRIPQQHYPVIEAQVAWYLTHEILHKVLLKTEGRNACNMLDNLLPDNDNQKRRAFLELFAESEWKDE
jgi:hypothetical protein